MIVEFVYTWPDGQEEVRYRRPSNTDETLAMIEQVEDLRAQHGAACPYSYREVPGVHSLDEPDDPTD